MWYTIKKGRNRPTLPFRMYGVHCKRNTMVYQVMFDESCRYGIQGLDQKDWNKLFGWSSGYHMNNSIRVAWRYDEDLDAIQLAPYIHCNGYIYTFDESPIYVPFNTPERVVLDYDTLNINHISVYTTKCGSFKTLGVIDDSPGYNLGLYFGGNNDSTNKDNIAPHDMKIFLKRIK